MNRIKIVFLLGTLDIGGTERQFIELIRRIDRERFELRVLAFLCHGKLRTEIEAAEIPFTCLGFSGLQGKYHPGSYLQIYRLIRDIVRYLKQERPLIMQSYLFWTNIYGSIAAKLAGVPVIVTGRRAIMEARYTRFPGQWLQHLSNKCATAILANSQTVKAECLQLDRAVTDEKIHVIHNGISLENYAKPGNPAAKKQELHLAAESFVIGMIANLHPRKRHEDLLRAAPLVLQRYPQTILFFVGRDVGVRASLEALAETLGIRASVKFIGERSDIPELLAIIDILVSTSEVEGLSNVVLEAMAAGKPVIATYIGGKESVLHEQTGLLLAPRQPERLAEAILRLLENPALREQFGRAGRERVATYFRVETMVQQTEIFYQELVSAYA